jgi:ribonuclease P protein component
MPAPGCPVSAFQLSVFPPIPMRFRTEQHLRRQNDFRSLRAEGRRIDRGAFTLWWRRREGVDLTPPSIVRVGVVASIAAVGPAVRRNAAKRRLREIFRRHQELVPPGSDLLLVARASLNRLEFADAEAKFVDACRQLAARKND